MTSPSGPLDRLRPADRLPPPPEGYEVGLVLGRGASLEANFSRPGEAGISPFSIGCDATNRLRYVGVFRADGEYVRKKVFNSPTGQYARRETELIWRRDRIAAPVRRQYEALCRDVTETVVRHLEPFRTATERGIVEARPLSGYEGSTRDWFDSLVQEYGFFLGPRALTRKIRRHPVDGALTVWNKQADGTQFTGVDLDGNNRFDVFYAGVGSQGRPKIFLYDAENAPAEIRTTLHGVSPELRLTAPPRESYRPMREALSSDHRGIYIKDPETPTCKAGGPSLCVEPRRGALAIEFWGLGRSSTQSIRIYTLGEVRGFDGLLFPHRFSQLPSLDVDEEWLAKDWEQHPDIQAIWRDPRGGVVRFRLKSGSASGKIRTHTFEIPFRRGGEQFVEFEIPSQLIPLDATPAG